MATQTYRPSSRAWYAVVSAFMLAVALLILWPHAPKKDDSEALAHVLNRVRRGIALYRQRHDHGPAKLQDMVDEGELAYVPSDPITNAADWRLDREESAQGSGGGIADVHSNAPGKDAGGRAFSDY